MAGTNGSLIGDTFAGAAGASINRPALNAYVAQGQAMAGLRTAQSEDALMRAQQMREEMDAGDQLESAFTASGMQPSQARAAALMVKGRFGTSQQGLEAVRIMQNIDFRNTMGDPSKLNTPEQTAAEQGISGKVAEPTAVPDTYSTPPGVQAPNTGTTAHGDATTANVKSEADLREAQATNPQAFHPGYGGLQGGLSPELQTAVNEGRLDPSRLNSRTVAIYDQLAKNTPTLNFNHMISQAALQRNPTFAQRGITMESMPDVMSTMTALGKKLGYADFRTVGRMQSFLNGEFNDPNYQEYMSVRNDALMTLASTMRGVGMSDQAHRAEIEAAAPTMSPRAMDAWFKGQMETLAPRMKRYGAVMHLGEGQSGDHPGAATTVPEANSSDSDPLGILGGK